VKTIGYYLSLLESNGTQPYVQLANELRSLPDLSNATAVAKIAFLALNATNPEVKEAFELMIKGGTPDQSDFKYSVPDYNTELHILYWLACQSEFKQDDTTALAIAMTHGLWIALGDEEVRTLVRSDASDFLAFLRETNQLQIDKRCISLEKHPLEAKICLAWRGDQSSVRSYHDPRDYLNVKMGKKGYRWATIELTTLTQMRDLMDGLCWIQPNVMSTIRTLELRFFTGPNRNWIYPESDYTIVIEGESIVCHNYNSADLVFKYYLANGKGIGWCSDEMGFPNALCKSWGIATTSLWGDRIIEGKKEGGHTHVVCFDPSDRSWKADPTQLELDVKNRFNHFFISQPKVALRGFAESNEGIGRRYVFSKFIMTQSDVMEIRSLFLSGVSTSQMKQWLLYS